MSFTLQDLAQLRPYLFHLTARENWVRIAKLKLLESATTLARKGGRDDLLTTRRRSHTPILVGGETVVLRDQAPLHAGNMRLDASWSFDRFVSHLNDRVFFWPGSSRGPISYGERHFGRYEGERPIILRIPFISLLDANPDAAIQLCRFNSGSPRWSRGVAAPRGASTFVRAGDAPFRAAQVVEVTVSEVVVLPGDTSWGESTRGPWTIL